MASKATFSKGEGGCVGRTDAPKFDPDELVLITDPTVPGYDPRSLLPPDEGMVGAMIAHGWVGGAITIRPVDGRAVVDDGRQRVLAAREANRRLREAGQPPILVPALCRSRSGMEAELVGAILNSYRVNENPGVMAEKAKRLQGYGYEVQDIARAFNVTVATVKNWLGLADAGPAAVKAVKEGRASAAAVKKAAEKGEEALAAVAAAEDKGQAREAANGGEKPTKGLSPKVVQGIIDAGKEAQELADRLHDETQLNYSQAVAYAYHAGLRRAVGLRGDKC